MILSIKNGGYAFLIRLDLMFSMSIWKEFQLLQILNDLSIGIPEKRDPGPWEDPGSYDDPGTYQNPGP